MDDNMRLAIENNLERTRDLQAKERHDLIIEMREERKGYLADAFQRTRDKEIEMEELRIEMKLKKIAAKKQMLEHAYADQSLVKKIYANSSNCGSLLYSQGGHRETERIHQDAEARKQLKQQREREDYLLVELTTRKLQKEFQNQIDNFNLKKSQDLQKKTIEIEALQKTIDALSSQHKEEIHNLQKDLHEEYHKKVLLDEEMRNNKRKSDNLIYEKDREVSKVLEELESVTLRNSELQEDVNQYNHLSGESQQQLTQIEIFKKYLEVERNEVQRLRMAESESVLTSKQREKDMEEQMEALKRKAVREQDEEIMKIRNQLKHMENDLYRVKKEKEDTIAAVSEMGRKIAEDLRASNERQVRELGEQLTEEKIRRRKVEEQFSNHIESLKEGGIRNCDRPSILQALPY